VIPPTGGHLEKQPLVSIIVPAWNAAETLRETLQSASAQTYENVEIVIVDDGSSDQTAAIAAEFCRNESHARLVRQGNLGLSAARNRAVRESSGLWIAPLDADDLWHPTKIEKQVHAALAAPVVPGFVYCWYQYIDEHGYILGSGPRWAFNGPALKRLAYQNTIHTALLSRRAIESVSGYDESLRACEDVMIQLQIARRFPVATVPEHLVGYRQRPDSMSRNTDLVILSWKAVLAQLVADGADIPPRLIRWIDAFFYRIMAERRITEGAFGEALRLFASALRRDPLRWGPYGIYRLTRTAVRLVRGRRLRLERMHFYSVDPRTFISPDPDELPVLISLLDRMEAARLSRLAAKETVSGVPEARAGDPAEQVL
jgi:glycosyltransferase involved in cell wall biosynthesis